jgi:hypothetical protein
VSLLQMALNIQEELLFLPSVASCKDPIAKRELRAVVAVVDWGEQRMLGGASG